MIGTIVKFVGLTVASTLIQAGTLHAIGKMQTRKFNVMGLTFSVSRSRGFGSGVAMGSGKGCSVNGCHRPHHAKNYCNPHYWRARHVDGTPRTDPSNGPRFKNVKGINDPPFKNRPSGLKYRPRQPK